MKSAIILSANLKQIMFTAENKSEEMALKMITPDDDISVEIKSGSLYDASPHCARGYVVTECKEGYLRAYDDKNSLMLVLRPKNQRNRPQEEGK